MKSHICATIFILCSLVSNVYPDFRQVANEPFLQALYRNQGSANSVPAPVYRNPPPVPEDNYYKSVVAPGLAQPTQQIHIHNPGPHFSLRQVLTGIIRKIPFLSGILNFIVRFITGIARKLVPKFLWTRITSIVKSILHFFRL